MTHATQATHKLLDFVAGMTRLVSVPGQPESALLDGADALMRMLIATDDWLPDAMAQPHPQYYQQHLLYGDPLDRFSVVSFVWGPGQMTPVHNHTVWGVIGMLRGAECGMRYAPDTTGLMRPVGAEQRLEVGMAEHVSPRIGDVHRVRNAHDDRVSVSIHVYGGNIGRIHRHVFLPDTGEIKDFVSGYSNAMTPNLWQEGGA
jgi:predicted metal-dependent enzyme (double-stranded beta helix superfamily)